MPDNPALLTWARAAAPWRWAWRRAATPPRKALILRPCCLSQVLLATPLLAALSTAYPSATFDWAVSEWARPAVAANPRLRRLVEVEASVLANSDDKALVRRLKKAKYDTVFIPSQSAYLGWLAWRAGIPQRVGLYGDPRGFAHTVAVPVGDVKMHTAQRYLALAKPFAVATGEARVEFYPTDRDRAAITDRLLAADAWEREAPLVVLHPGGGHNPVQPAVGRRWPAERFARLGNHLVKKHRARVILVGEESASVAATAAATDPVQAVVGLMPKGIMNWSGQLSLGEVGALAEVADLYVGNDTGPTHVAVGVGCVTLAIFGPSDPGLSGPWGAPERYVALQRPLAEPRPLDEPFSWDQGVSVDEATAAADQLLDAFRSAG